ncbi:MAG: hypothetical protein DRP18_05525 [Candidatus Aenigmatarchaeota archaeon]|nr:MAG: hypothetical protein DRP18_05525 [Candidatus Aenigmarchaeota archaeon]
MKGPDFSKRIKKLRSLLQDNNLDSALITDRHDIRYYTGCTITGPGFLIIGKQKPKLFLSSIDNHIRTKQADVLFFKDLKEIKSHLKQYKKTGFDEYNMKAYTFIKLKNKNLVPAGKIIKFPRMVKDEWEMKQIKKSIKITAKIFETLEVNGKKEKEIAREIEILSLKLNTEKAFPPIVATGKNTGFIHHIPTNAVVLKGLTIIDMGVKFNGYCSDITRMFYSKITQRGEKLIEDVKEIQETIIDEIREGVTFSEIEKFYEKLMKRKGYKVYHSFGHGVGLEVHEGPSKTDILRKGMVVTVEPGVYKKGIGCRIEDMIKIEKMKAKPLSKFIPL